MNTCSVAWRVVGRVFLCVLFSTVGVLPRTAHPQGQGQTGCGSADQDCTAALKQHVIKTRAYWEPAFAKPLEQRIGPVSAQMIDFITLDNIKNSIANRPRIPALTPDFLRDVRQAFAELPAAVKSRLEGKLAGIYFAEDFGGTGFSDEIGEAESRPDTGFIVLDSAVLSGHVANAWATWKENTPFKPLPGFELVAMIEDKSDDNRKNAIQYILLHELGHVLSIGEKIHPPWTIDTKDIHSTKDLPYFSLSWTLPKGSDDYTSLFDASFPQRTDVRYYFGAKLSADRMIETYDRLEATNLPTLYAATHPGDDWAEAFVTYVHTVLMNKPFAIRIYRDGKLAKEYKACWTEKRCEQKRKIIEHFLAEK
jgi:hypothetical protein